jgi:hypothetical protein
VQSKRRKPSAGFYEARLPPESRAYHEAQLNSNLMPRQVAGLSRVLPGNSWWTKVRVTKREVIS